jgi:hypothetical protein
VFRDADAVRARRIHHDDAAVGCSTHVDVVDAGAGAGNHPKARGGGDEGGVHLCRAANNQRVGLRKVLCQVAGRALGACIDCPTGHGPKDFNS